jgi:ActR/RegA family two-component response regulator
MTTSKMARDPRTTGVKGSPEIAPEVSIVPNGDTPVSSRRGNVLVIRDWRREAQVVWWALRALDLESSWVSGGMEGIATLRRTPFDLVLVDELLHDMSAADVVRTLRAEYDSSRFVILKNGIDTSSPAASTPGDVGPGVLERPFRCRDVISVVNAVLEPHAATACATRSVPGPAVSDRWPSTPPVQRMATGSIAERWVHFVLGTIDAEIDPKTVSRWARTVGVSRSVLSECCRLVHVSPQDARDFARLLRAICHCGQQWEPEAVLDLADARTLRKLLARAGLSGVAGRTPAIREFLDRQNWIPQTNSGLQALRCVLFDDARLAAG